MEEPELEEGEACYYKDEDNASIDPEITLSYIDEKLQDVLGHFQKDFEGGVAAENLGAKYGGYGSFLPTYQRSPSIWSHPKTPRRVQDNNREIFPILMEGCPQINKAPSNAHLSEKPGTTSSHGPSSHISGVPSGKISVKQDSPLPPAPVTEMSPPRHGTSNKSVNPTGQRMPKVRIKVGSANAEKRNAAIYAGLGLDNSPSSSLGNSLDERGGMPLKSQETLQESPTSILQIMTSFAVPEGVLLSPLPDSFVCLIRKKKISRNSKSLPARDGSRERRVCPSDEAAVLLVGEEMLIENKTRLVGESEWQAEVKHGSGMDFKNDMAFPLKEVAEHQFPEDMVLTGDVGDSGKVTDRSTEIFREANKDILKERVSFSDFDKEDSLESITGQDSATSVQWNVESSLENTRECGVACSNKDVSADHREDGRCKGDKLLAQFRADSDMFRGKEDTDIGEMDHGRIAMSCKKGKQLWEGKKKLKGAQIRGESAPHLAEEGLRIGFCSAPKDEHNLTSQKDIEEVKNNPRELLTNRKSEQMDDRIDTLKRHGERARVSDYKDVEKGGSTFFNLKGISSGKRVENQYASEASLQVALNPPFTNNRFTTKTVPAAAGPVVIEENWVCCDRCQKWRLLPFGKKPEDLPEKWLCSMLSWLPGLNSCDISEEETTKAINTLYQHPIHESQTSMHNHVNGIASGVTLDDVRHCGQNTLNPSTHDMPNEGKKKYGCKKLPNAGNHSGQIPNSANRLCQEPLKGSSLASMHNLEVDKHMHNQKEKYMSKGDLELKKTKNKRDTDKFGGEACKKSKKEDACYSGKFCNFKHGRDLEKVCLVSDTIFPVRATKEEVTKSKEFCYSTDSNCDEKDRIVVSMKNLEDKAQVSVGGESLAVKTCERRNIALKEREDIENQTEVFQTTKHQIQENKVFVKKKNEEIDSRKAKKTKLSIKGMESDTSKGDSRSSKSVMTRILSFGNEGDKVDNVENVRSTEKYQLHKMLEENVASQQNLDSMNSMIKDVGTAKVPMAAASSSPKASGSHKTRANFQEVKGSPAESVSSSPLRTSKLGNLTSEKGSILKKVDPTDAEPSKSKFTAKAKPSELGNGLLVNGEAVTSEHHHQYTNDRHAVEHFDNENNFCRNALFPQESIGGSSKRSKENNGSSRSDFDSDKMTVCDPLNLQGNLHAMKWCKFENDPQHLAPKPETVSDVRHSCPDKDFIKYNVDEKNHVTKGDFLGKCSSDRKEGNLLKFIEHDGSNLKLDDSHGLDGRPTTNKILNQSFAEKTNQKELESRGKTVQLFPHRKSEPEIQAQDFQSIPGPRKQGVFDACSLGTSATSDVQKALKKPGNTGIKNRNQQGCGHILPDENKVKDLSAPNPLRKDSSGHTATNTLKEAKDLRDYADRLKSSGFAFESYETYFQAAIKFLQGASLLETYSNDTGKNGIMTQIQAYCTAAKLCELCAHEYEKRQEMSAAALAYKCMEVAYMRVVYCKHTSINRDRHELQGTLQITQGESPSSSASDIDNLNNQTDKAAPSKVSHVGGKHVIVARNHPHFVRLLDFTQDVNFAIEALRKSQTAFVAANVLLEETQNREGITSVRRVIDFSFQDVEGLIRLVRLAQEASSYSGLNGNRE